MIKLVDIREDSFVYVDVDKTGISYDLVEKYQYFIPDLSSVKATKSLLSAFSIENLNIYKTYRLLKHQTCLE